jgi:hypothetical protein
MAGFQTVKFPEKGLGTIAAIRTERVKKICSSCRRFRETLQLRLLVIFFAPGLHVQLVESL